MWNQNSPSPNAPIGSPSTLMLLTRSTFSWSCWHAFGAAAQRLRRLLAAAEIAEIGRETKLVVLADLLAAEHQHEMLGPGVLDGLDRAPR